MYILLGSLDTSIQHTMNENTVSVGLLAVVSFIIPVIIFAVMSLVMFSSFWDFHAGFLGEYHNSILSFSTKMTNEGPLHSCRSCSGSRHHPRCHYHNQGNGGKTSTRFD